MLQKLLSANRTNFLLVFLLISFQIQAQKNLAVKSNGHIMHAKTFGKGTPVLIINGGPGMSSEGFIPLVKRVGEYVQAIIYDQRGTGKSKLNSLTKETVTLDLMIQDIETLRKHLKIEKWIVYGHSFGGMLASYYATKHPNRISGMILSSSGGIDMELFSTLNLRSRLSKKQRDSLAYWSSKIRQGDTSYKAAYNRGKYLAPAYLYDTTYVETVAHRLTQGNITVNGLVYQSMRKINFDCREGLKTYKKPVLIIQGKQDIIPIEISIKTEKTLPNSKLIVVDKCSHYGWLEQPEVYLTHVKKFIQSIKK